MKKRNLFGLHLRVPTSKDQYHEEEEEEEEEEENEEEEKGEKEEKEEKEKEKEEEKPPKKRKKKPVWISRAELAQMLNCHIMSIPKFEKNKPGFPRPRKPYGPLGKTMYDADEAEAYVKRVFRPVEAA